MEVSGTFLIHNQSGIRVHLVEWITSSEGSIDGWLSAKARFHRFPAVGFPLAHGRGG